jgi:polyphosphate kinase 2 (PPK2 family)
LEWFLEKIDRAEEMIMGLVKKLENSKTDSILDLGLSKFEHREKFREFVESNGYELKTYFLDISKETRLKRVIKRNNAKGDTFEFEVSRENFDFMESWFEIPNEKEIEGGITITE